MALETLEARVARLEQQMNLLIGRQTDYNQPPRDHWQKTVRMFRGDPIVQEMIEESRPLREEDRRSARQGNEPSPP
jgi:hypothetical protein